MDDLLSQLQQMKTALEIAQPEDKPALQLIISQLEELVELSTAEYSCNNDSSSLSQPSFAEDEFTKFQAEIAALDKEEPLNSDSGEQGNCTPTPRKLEESSDNCNSKIDDIDENEDSIMATVAALEGTKCSAPHQPCWGQLGFYNAVILGIECIGSSQYATEAQDTNPMDSIKVRVAFSQPIVASMLPCPFYQESRCRFDDNECKFSHGEIVALSNLRDYKEPDFSQIFPGSRVIAKYSDGLWYKATVLKVTDDTTCEIRYDIDGKETAIIPLHETAPAESTDEESSNSDSDLDDDACQDSSDDPRPPSNFKVFGNKETFGEWEKHTRGIGSKLMSQMGYVMGGGLGKHGEGRLDPVDARLYPPGLSIDTCIKLREGSGKKVCTVEEKLNRQRKKAENNFNRSQKNSSVFDFINSKLEKSFDQSTSFSISKPKINSVQMNKASRETLNKSLLSVGENITQVKRKISKLKEGMVRQSGRDNTIAEKMKEQISEHEIELEKLHRHEKTLVKERNIRNEKKKLVVF